MSTITRITRLTAATAAAALVAVPAAVLTAAPAHADLESRDTEKHVACAGGHLELSVDREGSGWEIDASVDDVASNQKWRFVLKHDGQRFFKGARVTDNDGNGTGDADVDRYRQDSAGKDTFWVKAVRLSDGTTCKASVTVG